ncbi:MAG: amino acid--tRNA ligase-related protein [Candidatus Roizmanbacteria bacterium]
MTITTLEHQLAHHKQFLQILSQIDLILQSMNYSKIMTPLLSPVLIAESYLEVYESQFISMGNKQKQYLIPSTELFLKRLIAKGIGNCYSLEKNFRNSEPNTTRHSPEFMMLEMYKVNADYMEVAEDVLALFQSLAHFLYNKNEITFHDKTISFDGWEKITVTEAFDKHAGIKNIVDEHSLRDQAKIKGYTTDGFTYSEMWSQIYAQEVEPHLGTNGKPTIIYEYPKELGATAQINTEKGVAERLEIYIDGVEIGNCGNSAQEGVDWNDMEQRFLKEEVLRKELGKVDHPPDREFISILKSMPKTAGIAIGVERLVMILLNLQSIQELQIIRV